MWKGPGTRLYGIKVKVLGPIQRFKLVQCYRSLNDISSRASGDLRTTTWEKNRQGRASASLCMCSSTTRPRKHVLRHCKVVTQLGRTWMGCEGGGGGVRTNPSNPPWVWACMQSSMHSAGWQSFILLCASIITKLMWLQNYFFTGILWLQHNIAGCWWE